MNAGSIANKVISVGKDVAYGMRGDYAGFTKEFGKKVLKSNMTELEWNSIRNSLRMITPDGETVYNEIYYQFYYDSDKYGSWQAAFRNGGMNCSDSSFAITAYNFFRLHYFKICTA